VAEVQTGRQKSAGAGDGLVCDCGFQAIKCRNPDPGCENWNE